MTSFDDRQKSFERKFALDEELNFKSNARRNKLLGLWAAEKIGLSGAEAKGKEFPFKGQDDLIGNKGVTNEGESYGNAFDTFMKNKLDVARADVIDEAFKELLAGKADYLIAGYHPGHAEAAKSGLKGKIVSLEQALLTAEMFVAFSKKSQCRSLASDFGQGITEMTTDGSFDKMLNAVTTKWHDAEGK